MGGIGDESERTSDVDKENEGLQLYVRSGNKLVNGAGPESLNSSTNRGSLNRSKS